VLSAALAAVADEGASSVEFFGYDDCIELHNASTRVVLCPAAGGRVLVYAYQGENGLYLDPAERGWKSTSVTRPQLSAGRFDIGPENIIPRRDKLWLGPWQGEVTGPRQARLTSLEDEATGVQLIRDFKLAADSTRLECTQTIRNVSQETKEWCHWSRTFARGNGICLIPLTPYSRFPNKYVMYEPGSAINIAPEDPQIHERDGFLEILGVPRQPKLGMDSYAGWFAYAMRNDLLFVKRYRTYPDRVYNEVAGLTISIWYPADRRVELEPIGPRERIEPGGSAAFTEVWYLLPLKYPAEDEQIDLDHLQQLVDGETEGVK
jgi:hypothetical protein